MQAELINYIKTEYGFSEVKGKKLNGYNNANYLVRADGEKYIFKTYIYSESLHDMVCAESDILLELVSYLDFEVPAPEVTADGDIVSIAIFDGKQKTCRMLSFLEGDFLGDVPHTAPLIQSLGALLAKLDLQLRNYKSYTLQSRVWVWDLQYFELNKKYIKDIADAKDRNIVRYFFQQYDAVVRPCFPQLRKQIIHNDANEWNVLVKGDKLVGFIDFGDIAHSFLINEVAIAMTYVSYDKKNPLKWACILLESYHKTLPLEKIEIKVLYYLIAARLCTSVCNSAHSRIENPDNTYASVSEASAWKMLRAWLAIGPIQATNHFKKAIGMAVEPPVSIDTILSDRYRHTSPILSTSYSKPIHMVRAAFQYMYDASGNAFLDAYNNIPHVGHAHPKIVSAGQKQMAVLNTNTRYLYHQLAEYATRLASKFPPKLNKVFLVNSGSAATDLAIRLAKSHTRFEHIMVLESGYHGNTQTGIDVSDYKFNNPKGQGQKDFIVKTALPDVYKGKYSGDEPEKGKLYAKDVKDTLSNLEAPIAAFIAEPIVGCAGQVPLADGYLQEVYPAIRAQGGVCISDEVQTGFGRVGDHFWGYETQGVVPDIVILGKPIANGHPMGAVVCTNAIAASFEKGVEFFSSFGGNPVSCTIATAVLDVIEEESLQQNAKETGAYYKGLFKSLQSKYPCIGDVRGSGLFIGIEIVKGNSKLPDTALAKHIKNALREQHILISTDGAFDNVIKTKPALCFNMDNAKTVVDTFDAILSRYYKNNLTA